MAGSDADSHRSDGAPGSAHDTTIQGDIQVEPVRSPLRPHLLEQVRGLGAPLQLVLRQDRVLIGRSPECEISIDSAGISWHHLLITRHGPEFSCEDCDSTNGVYLNGIRIQSAVLREGDQIQVSDAVFIYREGT